MLTPEFLGELKSRIDTAVSNNDIPALIDMLKEDNWKVCQEACFALSEMGSNAVEPLIGVVSDGEAGWSARGHAALALRNIGDARAVDPLLSALEDDEWEVRGYASWALGRFGDARAVEPLKKVYERDDNEKCSVRNWVVGSLGEIGDAGALEFLHKVVEEDPDHGVRASARRAVAALEGEKAS
ncbi:MAG: HEAT repeat domain-containing protein [Candidatus Poribacteria bacterium]|nr:HEAT repeat domain-containing protein [Candidatus Poribacteria bacterium]